VLAQATRNASRDGKFPGERVLTLTLVFPRALTRELRATRGARIDCSREAVKRRSPSTAHARDISHEMNERRSHRSLRLRTGRDQQRPSCARGTAARISDVRLPASSAIRAENAPASSALMRRLAGDARNER
jgi:hypothetical protein